MKQDKIEVREKKVRGRNLIKILQATADSLKTFRKR